MKTLILSAALALPLLCSQAVSAEPLPAELPAVKIDTSTPEKALKSYWAYLDWREWTNDARTAAYLRSKQHELELTQRNQLMAGPRQIYEKQRDDLKPSVIYSREIQKVRMDGENKAVIDANIKNITPIDSKLDLQHNMTRNKQVFLLFKESGSFFQYELEKQSGGWRVTQVMKKVGDGINANYVDPEIPDENLIIYP